MSVLRTLVNSSRALVTGAREVARFREISTVFIRHGFGWVVAQLKLRRELEVDHEGADLTRAALANPDTGKRLVRAFTELGPTYVKLGQILSTRSDLLPQPILDELVTLQDDVDEVEWKDVEEQLERNLGTDWRGHFKSFEEKPMASASIAQVHRAVLKDGEEVVLKVQRPGLAPKIESDLGILYVIAGLLEDALEEAQAMDLRGTIIGFTKSISQELDFRIEARNLERFQRLHAGNETVLFPKVYDDLSTKEVLCMEFMSGRKFSDVIEAGEDPGPMVGAYFGVAYKMLFIDGFFHGDLHPGNVLAMDGGKLGILDCGMVGRLSTTMKERVIDILYAVINEDLEGVARTFYELSIKTGPVDYPKFEADVIEIGERYLIGLPLSEVQIGTLLAEIVTGATRHQVRMPTDFTMMFKAILTTEGMAKSIAPDTDPIELARPFIMKMVAERYDPERIKRAAISDFQQLSRLMRTLPNTLPAMIDDIRRGNLAVSLSDSTLDRQKRDSRARLRRTIRAAVSITCIVCGTYTMGLPLPIWELIGLPFISVAFLLAGGLGLFTVMWR